MFQKSDLVRKIFYTNIVVFILTILSPSLLNYLAIYPFSNDDFHFYQFITSLFTHGGIIHIGFNMLALLSFGPSCEIDLGEKKFLSMYFIAGFVGAILQLQITGNPLIGASASIFGLLLYSTLLDPNQKLILVFLPFISFKAKWLVSLIVLFEIYSGFFGKADGIGHIAHLGGGLVGVISYVLNKNINVIRTRQ